MSVRFGCICSWTAATASRPTTHSCAAIDPASSSTTRDVICVYPSSVWRYNRQTAPVCLVTWRGSPPLVRDDDEETDGQLHGRSYAPTPTPAAPSKTAGTGLVDLAGERLIAVNISDDGDIYLLGDTRYLWRIPTYHRTAAVMAHEFTHGSASSALPGVLIQLVKDYLVLDASLQRWIDLGGKATAMCISPTHLFAAMNDRVVQVPLPPTCLQTSSNSVSRDSAAGGGDALARVPEAKIFASARSSIDRSRADDYDRLDELVTDFTCMCYDTNTASLFGFSRQRRQIIRITDSGHRVYVGQRAPLVNPPGARDGNAHIARFVRVVSLAVLPTDHAIVGSSLSGTSSMDHKKASSASRFQSSSDNKSGGGGTSSLSAAVTLLALDRNYAVRLIYASAPPPRHLYDDDDGNDSPAPHINVAYQSYRSLHVACVSSQVDTMPTAPRYGLDVNQKDGRVVVITRAHHVMDSHMLHAPFTR